jgi:hypothetical protein
MVMSASHCDVEARDGEGDGDTLDWLVDRDTCDVAREDDDDCVVRATVRRESEAREDTRGTARRWGIWAMTNGMRLAVGCYRTRASSSREWPSAVMVVGRGGAKRASGAVKPGGEAVMRLGVDDKWWGLPWADGCCSLAGQSQRNARERTAS